MVRHTRRTPLSRERALAAATDLADAEGITALTMRRLASALGVEAMSLYHHLPGKEGLLDGLVEAVVDEIAAEVEQLDVGNEWRERLRERCLAARRVMLRHPWAPGLIASRPAIPPSLYPHFEDVLATMIDGGFSYHLAHRALHTLGSMILGFTQELFVPTVDSGETDETAEADLAAMADALPHLTTMVAAELHALDDPTLGWCDSQVEFEFSLDLLLDGLARAKHT